ncbi:MAG: EpsG family protein [Bacteroides sp.]|nr:EpsG family protein [Roseburia sp.]MCM1347425.1 EpsG family protein [Bacteroides sp.]MCM1421571.1 EpsG family protein [Bacteroides sp.]
MLSFDFCYDSINFILLLVMFYVGHSISSGKFYWQYAAWGAIAFIIIEGLRYGRGVDYMHYVDVYNYDLESGQRLFTGLNELLKSIGVSAVHAFMFYAIPFIVGGCTLLKTMRKYALYTYPLFLISFISFHEAFIRQALATSFIFLYVVRLNKILVAFSRTKIKASDICMLIIYFLIAYSIHSVAAVGIFVITVIFIFIKKPLPYIVIIPIFLIGKLYLASHFDWSYINGLLSFMSSHDDKLACYADNADRWFSDDAMSNQYSRNAVIQILETVADTVLIYLGAKVCQYILGLRVMEQKQGKYIYSRAHVYVAFYNVFVVGVLIFQTFFNLEIVRRVAYSWYLFWFVPLALVLYYRKNTRIFNQMDRYMMLSFIFWIWDYIRFLFVFDKAPMFIWDK